MDGARYIIVIEHVATIPACYGDFAISSSMYYDFVSAIPIPN
jgi:hypothetical protein